MKEIMIAAVSGMIVYGGLYELFIALGLNGSNNLEAVLIRVVVSLAVAIAVLFVVFGLIKKVKKANKES
jgi:hypothetical protein